MSLTDERRQAELTDECNGIDERKVYGPPRVQRIETKDTEAGGRPAYIEDGTGIYQS